MPTPNAVLKKSEHAPNSWLRACSHIMEHRLESGGREKTLRFRLCAHRAIDLRR